jgi:hypothetical protein
MWNLAWAIAQIFDAVDCMRKCVPPEVKEKRQDAIPRRSRVAPDSLDSRGRISRLTQVRFCSGDPGGAVRRVTEMATK